MQLAVDGFNFLHSRQPPIIHQDIKPDNILINSSREAAISDFGLAKIQSNSPTGMTTDKVTMGTLLYMAPELHLDTSAEGGPETDVYAFVLLILEILSGKRPYWNMKMHLLVAVMRGIQPKPEDHPDLQNRDIWSLLERRWHLEPSNRPSMAAVLQALQQRACDTMCSATSPVLTTQTISIDLSNSLPEPDESAKSLVETRRGLQPENSADHRIGGGPSGDDRALKRSRSVSVDLALIAPLMKPSPSTFVGHSTASPSVASGRPSKRPRLSVRM
ncbi:Ankyrin repeat and protein kinase domain-containing protein 1 [Tulasnella sp. JGI-2019a]|nr:Ankyrin repeat and protein kinase domain-containing protein 1 [Tulasnella sp. JGI-2019a]